MKRNQIYTGIIVFVCCVLVAIGVTLRLLKHADKLPVKVPVLVNRQKPQVADTLKKKPVAKPDFRISGTLKDTEGRGWLSHRERWIQLRKDRFPRKI